MGGRSAEREVSMNTGMAIAEALRELGHSVIEIDVRRDLPRVLSMEEPDVAFVALHGRGGEDGSVQGLLEIDPHYLEEPLHAPVFTTASVERDKGDVGFFHRKHAGQVSADIDLDHTVPELSESLRNRHARIHRYFPFRAPAPHEYSHLQRQYTSLLIEAHKLDLQFQVKTETHPDLAPYQVNEPLYIRSFRRAIIYYEVGVSVRNPVSYTHLTLPTIYSV